MSDRMLIEHMQTYTYAVVDLETTGHASKKGDRIIQIAIVLIENGEITKRYTRFVNPGQAIPPFIQQLTDIQNDMVEQAPLFEEIAEEVSDLLTNTIFVAHNTDFDLPFLQAEFKRCKVTPFIGKKIDTVELSKILFPTATSYRLQDLAEQLDIPLPTAHRADDDAEATAHLFLKCIEKLQSLPIETIRLLHRRSFQLRSDLSMLFFDAIQRQNHNYETLSLPTFRGIPYRPIPIEQKATAPKITFPFRQVHEQLSLLRQAMPFAEQRTAQLSFMDSVWEAMTNAEEIVAEVPTGVGKTMGYLLPAAIFALQQNEPILISTYTNHLIDRIVTEEIPLLENMLATTLQVAVLKGRDQYLSFSRFEKVLQITEESYDESFTIMQMLVWLTETTTGDLNELNVSGGGQLLVDRVRKQSGQLAADEVSVDYHQRMLLKSEQAHLILTNHAMLFTDQNFARSRFNPISGLIIDEAHQMTHAAYQSSRLSFFYTQWKYMIGQISSEAEGQLLERIDKLLKRLNCYAERTKQAYLMNFQYFLQAFDTAIQHIIHLIEKNGHFGVQTGDRLTIMKSDLPIEKQTMQQVAERLFQFCERASAYIQPLELQKEQLTEKEHAFVTEWLYWVRELTIKAGEWIELFQETNEEQFTTWIEIDRRSLPGSLTVVKSTLDGASMIQQLMTSLKRQRIGVVWTSGTMTIRHDERFVMRQLGIQDDVPLVTFEAPVHFYEGASVLIVDDMPDIQQVSQSDYVEAVAEAIIQTVTATGGRMFILFTSLEMLKQTYELIIESQLLTDYVFLAQGISSGSRFKLLKSFRQFEKSVLFGTNSFWEGVDVPGEALSAILVVRLPFSSPEDPYFKARLMQVQKQGAHPFLDFALPEAIMRFRQGFGRLIRNAKDTGFFIILDRRIETKSYGQQFLESLPDVPVKKVSLSHMVYTLEACYNRKGINQKAGCKSDRTNKE